MYSSPEEFISPTLCKKDHHLILHVFYIVYVSICWILCSYLFYLYSVFFTTFLFPLYFSLTLSLSITSLLTIPLSLLTFIFNFSLTLYKLPYPQKYFVNHSVNSNFFKFAFCLFFFFFNYFSSNVINHQIFTIFLFCNKHFSGSNSLSSSYFIIVKHLVPFSILILLSHKLKCYASLIQF